MKIQFSKSEILSAGILLALVFYFFAFGKWPPHPSAAIIDAGKLEEKVLPTEGVILPVKWGNLGKRMAEEGVIDAERLEALHSERGGLGEDGKKLLYGEVNDEIKMTMENSGLILNLLWAFGLGNKNDILEKGPMMAPEYGSPENFASTGGWTLARGNAMEHYSKHRFVVLAPEQQKLVENVSKNIYRPCCNNPTHFPDCNHGMAMLGLLELLAAQGASEEEMYKIALRVNSYWFPDTYLTIAQYLAQNGIPWEKAEPKEILGINYSSASGYGRILNQITTPIKRSGAGCGI